jgi:hypothetical protein
MNGTAVRCPGQDHAVVSTLDHAANKNIQMNKETEIEDKYKALTTASTFYY